jgi:transaldolase
LTKTKILAASLCHLLHVVQAARIGADVATLPPAVFEKLLDHPLTTLRLERFLADWKKIPLQQWHRLWVWETDARRR